MWICEKLGRVSRSCNRREGYIGSLVKDSSHKGVANTLKCVTT